MLQLCRAEDGVVFQVPATIHDIERLGSLEHFLSCTRRRASCPPPDGRRLSNGSFAFAAR
ncbi:hypothetical protein B0H17DRAFT_1060597 [Mycena rosella]|uniref:Uncharacterized protein n=1 Tax=Mycena rosella TaxID=1033263 RepID=A0AAD7DJR6_MYCRO|nr:hypothetical protein B0H17DRAFT_1060597 [Mycena rosella]